MNSIRRMIPLALLLTVGACAVHGQSIVVSGGHRSIVVSGRESVRSQATVSVPKSVAQPQKGSDPTSSTSPVVVDQSRDASSAGEVSVKRLQMWGSKRCGACKTTLPQAEAAARQLGITLEYFDYDLNSEWGESLNITLLPTICFVVNDKIVDREVGYMNSGSIVTRLQNAQMPEKAATKAKASPVSRSPPMPPMPARYVMYGEQQIDLETYGGCSSKRCGMCKTLRGQQAEYRRLKAIYDQAMQYQQTSIEIPDHQQPTPDDVLREVIDLLNLSPSDKLADLGCGDGRVLIAAVERYGCSGVGVEIDPVKADEARSNVQAAGLSGRITIITDDALRFWPADNGVTAAVAYLYPDLLEQLRPNLEQVRLVVTPFHQVPGMQMDQVGDVWVRRL